MCMYCLLQKYAGASLYPAKFTLVFMIQANEDQSREYLSCEYYAESVRICFLIAEMDWLLLSIESTFSLQGGRSKISFCSLFAFNQEQS